MIEGAQWQADDFFGAGFGGFGLTTVTDLIGGYAPGLSVLEYPEGIGRTIPANSDIIVFAEISIPTSITCVDIKITCFLLFWENNS